MEIKSVRVWDIEGVRAMCIRENFYTAGCCSDYGKMLNMVTEHQNPSDYDIYMVAKDILDHTNVDLKQTVENIMYLLINDVIKTCYTVEFQG